MSLVTVANTGSCAPCKAQEHPAWRQLSQDVWRGAAPEREVGQWRTRGGVDEQPCRGPDPFGAPDLALRRAFQVDQRGGLEHALGGGSRDDQLTGAHGEITPLS